jgi:hypothetical protein
MPTAIVQEGNRRDVAGGECVEAAGGSSGSTSGQPPHTIGKRMPPEAIVQRIVTRWTKRTRGAEGREIRARLPMAYELPDTLLVATSPCLQHFIERGESSGYSLREDCRERDDLSVSVGASVSSVRLAPHGDELEVAFAHAGDCGLPRRAPRSVRIHAGSWARVRYNGRFVGYDDAWYEGKILNVAFRVAPARQMFSATHPSIVLEVLANLL